MCLIKCDFQITAAVKEQVYTYLTREIYDCVFGFYVILQNKNDPLNSPSHLIGFIEMI